MMMRSSSLICRNAEGSLGAWDSAGEKMPAQSIAFSLQGLTKHGWFVARSALRAGASEGLLIARLRIRAIIHLRSGDGRGCQNPLYVTR
jgi:hypothetical protein